MPEDLVEMFRGKTVAIVDHKIDIVDEEGSEVPLYKSYNHHYSVLFGDRNFTADAYSQWKDNT